MIMSRSLIFDQQSTTIGEFGETRGISKGRNERNGRIQVGTSRIHASPMRRERERREGEEEEDWNCPFHESCLEPFNGR